MLSTALCTFTWIVQVPIASRLLEKLIAPEPAVAVTVPPQLFTTIGVVATTRFAGKLSVKLASIGTALTLLSMLNVIVLGVLVATVVGLKVFVMDGGCKTGRPMLALPPLELPKPDVFAV